MCDPKLKTIHTITHETFAMSGLIVQAYKPSVATHCHVVFVHPLQAAMEVEV
jgi:hypothetical protein